MNVGLGEGQMKFGSDEGKDVGLGEGLVKVVSGEVDEGWSG